MTKKMTLKQVEEIILNMTPDDALKYLYTLKEETEMSLDKLIEKYNKKKQSFEKEYSRYKDMYKYEERAYGKGIKLVAGVDEAGRGPLAGPVVAAAVILPENIFIKGLNDSKKLSSKQRDELYDIIIEKSVSYGIGVVGEKCIDEINILNATRKAMELSLANLSFRPELVLTDAESLKNLEIKQIPIIKGDTLSISIAAASIIAKVTRDRLIDKMDDLYKEYGFKNHKGYGTKEHIEAIRKYGICPIHRVSFTKKFVG